jgi:hypothetical protein
VTKYSKYVIKRRNNKRISEGRKRQRKKIGNKGPENVHCSVTLCIST